MISHFTHFNNTATWAVTAGQQPEVPVYDAEQVCFYLGMQIEELSEKLTIIVGTDATDELNAIADLLKAKNPGLVAKIDETLRSNPEVAAKFLDGDMDIIWVSILAARAMGVDPGRSYGLVTKANWDKFPGGVVTRDANGKVMKPEGWQGPDLVPCLPPVLQGDKT